VKPADTGLWLLAAQALLSTNELTPVADVPSDEGPPRVATIDLDQVDEFQQDGDSAGS
jgi:hypothetical protein